MKITGTKWLSILLLDLLISLLCLYKFLGIPQHC